MAWYRVCEISKASSLGLRERLLFDSASAAGAAGDFLESKVLYGGLCVDGEALFAAVQTQQVDDRDQRIGNPKFWKVDFDADSQVTCVEELSVLSLLF